MTSLNTHRSINSMLHGMFIKCIPNRIFTVSVSFLLGPPCICTLYLLNIINILTFTMAAAKHTDEESHRLITAFERLGAKPKTDRAGDLKQWMEQYLLPQQETGHERRELISADSPSGSARRSSTHVIHQPNVAIFSGDPD